MNRGEFRFFDRLRVRWAEVDMQKIVFNGHYLMYFDTAVAGYWRAMAMPYQETMDYLEGDLYVRKATLEYTGSARYDDNSMSACAVRASATHRSCSARRCSVARRCSSAANWSMSSPTRRRRPRCRCLRSCASCCRPSKPASRWSRCAWAPGTSWAARHGPSAAPCSCRSSRSRPSWNGTQPTAACVHAVAYNRFGMALGTGRLLEHSPGVAKIGRMAVLQAMRGADIGRALLDALIDCARQRGDHEVMLHAQMSAAGFYTRAGFTMRGSPFDEAGIAHVEMVRAL